MPFVLRPAAIEPQQKLIWAMNEASVSSRCIVHVYSNSSTVQFMSRPKGGNLIWTKEERDFNLAALLRLHRLEQKHNSKHSSATEPHGAESGTGSGAAPPTAAPVAAPVKVRILKRKASTKKGGEKKKSKVSTKKGARSSTQKSVRVQKKPAKFNLKSKAPTKNSNKKMKAKGSTNKVAKRSTRKKSVPSVQSRPGSDNHSVMSDKNPSVSDSESADLDSESDKSDAAAGEPGDFSDPESDGPGEEPRKGELSASEKSRCAVASGSTRASELNGRTRKDGSTSVTVNKGSGSGLSAPAALPYGNHYRYSSYNPFPPAGSSLSACCQMRKQWNGSITPHMC